MKVASLAARQLIIVEAERHCRTKHAKPFGVWPAGIRKLAGAQAEARPIDLRQVQVARGALLRRRY